MKLVCGNHNHKFDVTLVGHPYSKKIKT